MCKWPSVVNAPVITLCPALNTSCPVSVRPVSLTWTVTSSELNGHKMFLLSPFLLLCVASSVLSGKETLKSRRLFRLATCHVKVTTQKTHLISCGCHECQVFTCSYQWMDQFEMHGFNGMKKCVFIVRGKMNTLQHIPIRLIYSSSLCPRPQLRVWLCCRCLPVWGPGLPCRRECRPARPDRRQSLLPGYCGPLPVWRGPCEVRRPGGQEVPAGRHLGWTSSHMQ